MNKDIEIAVDGWPYLVETDGTVRSWDPIAGHYTLCHSMSAAAEQRVRSIALAQAVALIVGDDGTGDLRTIVDHAEPGTTIEELVDIVRMAREEAA